MKSNKIILTLAALGTFAVSTTAEARINQRQDRQQQRIAKGVDNGDLSARETVGLAAQQASIRAYERRSRADGNGLTPLERARIEQRQDRASKTIYRQKHD